MSKRLQVLLDPTEFQEIRELASKEHLTVAEWVRQALRAARTPEPRASVDAKLAAIRTAARFSFPAADIEQMNLEIERGYLEDDRS